MRAKIFDDFVSIETDLMDESVDLDIFRLISRFILASLEERRSLIVTFLAYNRLGKTFQVLFEHS